MQSSGDLGLLRRLLGEGLRALEGEDSEPDRLACCWVCRRLLLWCQAGELAGLDLEGLAGLLGDLGEPVGRIYADRPARALAAATARVELARALSAAGCLVQEPGEAPDGSGLVLNADGRSVAVVV